MNDKQLKVNNAKQEKASIVVVEHPEFEGDMKTNIISSIDMAEVISSFFAPAFADYYGCNVRINDGRANPAIANSMPIGTIYVDLFFKDNPNTVENAWKNIKLRGQDSDGRADLGARFLRVNNAGNNARAYEVTKETYEALEEFTFGNGYSRTNWNAHTQEITTPMSAYGKEEVTVCISGLSLNKIITKIYGEKSSEGRYEYIATPSTIIPSKTQEFIMQVTQLDLAAVRNLEKTLGIYNGSATQFHQYRR